MGSIPLPALDVKQQQAPDVLGNFARVLQLKNEMQLAPLRQQAMQQQIEAGQQENQIRTQQIKDQQAMTQAMQEWDGKDYNQLPGLMIKHGASAQAVMSTKNSIIESQKSLAALTTAQLAQEKQKNDFFAQSLDNVKSLPQEQQAQAFEQAKADAVQRGYLKPEEAQGLQYQGPQQLDLLEKSLLGHSGALAAASSQASIAKTQVETAKTEQEMSFGPSGPAADSKYRFLQQKLQLGQQLSAQDQAWVKGYEKQKLLVPATTANIRMEGFGKMRQFPVYDNQTKQTVYMDSNEINDAKLREPGRFTVPQYTPEQVGAKGTTTYMTSGKGGQQITAYNTALLHLNTLDRLAGDLNNTDIRIVNKAKQEWAKQTGNPAPANFAAAVNAMSGEVASALKASGATDQEIEKASSTFSNAQSPAQLKGAINTYRELLKGKASQLQRQYKAGMQGKPAFDGTETAPAQGNDPFAQFGGKAH